VAEQVSGFGGVYVDANAISPGTAAEVGARVQAGGATYVDGAVIGPPPRAAGKTRLFLSGPAAASVAETFDARLLGALVVDGPLTAASALKMSYAAWTKGSQALVLAARALAREQGVEDALVAEWERSQPDLGDRSRDAAFMAAQKGWRWIAEMEEIAESMAAAGLPAGFHQAAADLYARIPRANDVLEDDATVARVVSTLLAAPAADRV
jgi:3-hydroxyisobutyrate dehydrogenase-like beta-hydroxyacid dehydrogenase